MVTPPLNPWYVTTPEEPRRRLGKLTVPSSVYSVSPPVKGAFWSSKMMLSDRPAPASTTTSPWRLSRLPPPTWTVSPPVPARTVTGASGALLAIKIWSLPPPPRTVTGTPAAELAISMVSSPPRLPAGSPRTVSEATLDHGPVYFTTPLTVTWTAAGLPGTLPTTMVSAPGLPVTRTAPR